MRIYETGTILRPDLPEEQVNELISRIEGEVEKGGGKVTEVNQWGVRKLAYNIDRHSRGNYTFFKYAAPPMLVKDVEYLLRVTEGVVRFLTVKMEEEVDERELASIEKVHKKEEAPAPEEEEVSKEKEETSEAVESTGPEEAAGEESAGEESAGEESAGEEPGGEESESESTGSDEKAEEAGSEENATESETEEESE